MSYLKGSLPSSRTQVERTLALLVKSGFVYCVLLVFVVVYECSFLSSPPMAPAFTTGFYYVMNGCLVPLIGMYPTMIIIACAAEKSMNEKCVEEHVQNGSIVLNWPQAGSHRDAGEAILSELVNESDSTVHAGVRLMSDAGHFTDLESQDETNSIGRAAPHSAV
ncbi:hypothetical protein L226DRAFT_576775 [Lentinus tigrinus ALCF2SS1-7]|uniref:Uncharacterized protein n=1 Tax=Lentinus tigrinus ALCF2SS1-6 TaxID=1328759 RepID=A0A5C2RRK4_9APHY|nr:hypothetical protein L227DRAFT_567702 [Lentinus tigrinus ALCF2SS1-6]RPD68001.1 hypothetical protein L226DRAFT_576775 [Lentinus tigrinus ALCF2SS1-7]